jgi:hypothetical protein
MVGKWRVVWVLDPGAMGALPPDVVPASLFAPAGTRRWAGPGFLVQPPAGAERRSRGLWWARLYVTFGGTGAPVATGTPDRLFCAVFLAG